MATPLRRTAIVSLLLLATSATTGLARAAQPSPQLTADPAAVAAGATLSLEGRGFPRNVHVALMARPVHGEAIRIGGARTGSRGRFTATIQIRPRSSPGAFVAFACVDACRVKASAPFSIVAR